MRDWKSSYEENNYGHLFYSLVRIHRPEKIVELGTKAGYSAYHMAIGLRDNHFGTLDCYDLWEKYPYHSCPLAEAIDNLEEFKDIVKLSRLDAKFVEKMYDSINLLHIDLSNDGNILEEILIPWINKAKLIILEGGSKERDNVEWMKKHNKKPIKEWLKEQDFDYFTIEPFPSITLIRGRG